MNNNYIFDKITAIPRSITTLLSTALVMLLAYAAMAKSYFNFAWNDDALTNVAIIALFLGLLLLVIIPMTKRLSFRIGLRKATLLTMIMAASLLSTVVSAQAPGGVTANLKFWLKANAGTNPSGTSGTMVSWTDQKANITLNTDNINVGNPALVNGNKSVKGDYNYNPYLNFTVTSDMTNLNVPANLLTGTSGSVFGAWQRRASADNVWAYQGSTGRKWGIGARACMIDNDNTQVASAVNFPIDVTQVAGITKNGNALASFFNGEYDSTPLSQPLNGDALKNDEMVVGSGNNSAAFNGTLGEVIVYDRSLTQAEGQRIISYLGIKYGKHLGSAQDGTGTFDYLNSSGTVVWNGTTTRSAYHNDVAGIARDDNSGLLQLKSQCTFASSSAASDDVIRMSATSFASNNSFLMWGNNNASLAFSAMSGVTCLAGYNGTFSRTARVWTVQETGGAGVVTVEFVGGSLGSYQNVVMLVGSNASFTAGTYTEVRGIVKNGIPTFNYDFTSGQFFTFAGAGTPVACVGCTTGNNEIQWKTLGWIKGNNTKLGINLGGLTANARFSDPSAVEYNTAANPRRWGKTIHTRRRSNSGNPYNISLKFNAATKANFQLYDVDKNSFHNDKITVKGFCSGSFISPKLSYVKKPTQSDYTITGNQADGKRLGGYYERENRMNVVFDQAVDSIVVVWEETITKASTRFQRLGIGSATLACPVAGSCPNADNIYLAKTSVDKNVKSCEKIRYNYRISNESCVSKTVSVSDILPAGLAWEANSLEDGELAATVVANAYGGTTTLNLSNIVLAAGATLDFGATALITGAPGTYTSQATMQVTGGLAGTIQSDSDPAAGCQPVVTVVVAGTPPPAPNITLSLNKTSYSANEVVLVTFALNNSSGSPMTNVNLEQILDRSFTYVNSSITGVSALGGTVNAYAGIDVLEIDNMTIPTGTSTITIQATSTTLDSTARFIATVFGDPESDCAEGASKTSNEINLPAAVAITPGCVTAGLDFWLDPSKNVTKTGAVVTGWSDADASGNNPSLVQGTATLRPSYSDGDALSNFNPYINFTNNQRLNVAVTGSNYSSNTTTFGVVNKYAAKGSYNNFIRFSSADNSDGGTHNWGLGTSDLGEDKVALHYITAPFAGVAPGNIYNRLNGIKLFALNTPTIMSASLNATTGATSVGNNGNEVSATGKGLIGTFVPYNFLTVGGGNAFGMDNNKTSEIIHYSRELTIQERQRVQTYLAIKYGITLDNQDNSAAIVEGDYILGDGTTKVWDKTANTAYHNNVTVIGRDACQDLNQKQSKSVNADSYVTIGAAAIAATNAANTGTIADKSFDVIGDNGLAASYATAYTPSTFTPAGAFFLMSRVWKVQETGTVGIVTISVPAGAERLIVSNSAAFTPGASTQEIALTTDGNGNVTAQVDLANGQFFTFGKALTGPGGVVDTDFWVKSDDAGTVATAWKDHSTRSNPIEAVGTWSLTAANVAHNYYPYLTGFTASKYFRDANSSLTTDNTYGVQTRTPFAVFSAVRATGASGRIVGIDNDDLFAAEPGFSISANKPYFYKYWETIGSDIHSLATSNGQSSIFSYNATQIAANSCNMQIGKDGAYENNARTGYWHNLGKYLMLGYGTWDNAGPFPGDIMEVVWYKRTLTANEQDRVNSYLAIKNGTTLAVNYLASNSTIVWNRSTSTGFNNNIFGVARDNASALHQKQSKSVSGAMALGIDNEIATGVAAHTGGLDNNLNFLMVGDNGLTGITTLAPGGACTPAGPDKGTNKIWKFVETGTVETVKISTNLSPDFNGASTQVFMQVATDAAFTSVVSNIPARYNGTSGEFETSYDFTGTQYVRYIGVQTPPANACVGPSKDLNWLSFAPFDWWYWGTRSKTYTLGDGLKAKVTIDDLSNKILYGSTPTGTNSGNPTNGYYPVSYGNHLYIPRYDGNPTSTITTKIELIDGTNVKMPANGVSFKIKDIDGWWWGKDNVKVYGKLGGSIVNPKLSTNKNWTNVTLTQPNQGKGSIWPWDWTVLGDMYVNFDSPVDEIYVEHTKDNLFNFKVFNDIAIGGLDIQCKAPEPEVVTPDNVYLFKEVSPKTARAGEPFTYKFTFKNFNCSAKTINFTDALPSAITWKDSTLATAMTLGSTNAYGGAANLNITNLSIPVGTSYLYVDAIASTNTGSPFNNQASFTINGTTYQSDEPSIAGGANPTPVTILAAPQVANLTLTKSVDKSSAPQNSVIEYTLSVKNNGSAAVKAQVQDFLQGDATYTVDALVFTPASASTGTTVNTYANEGTLDIRDLTVGANSTVTIKVKAKLGTSPAVNDTLSNNFSANTGLGADAEFYSYKKFNSNAVKTLVQNLPSLAGTVFNDGGAGGGTPGNCIKDGTEGATGLPTGLYAKLIPSGGTAATQAVAVSSGTYSFPATADGAYTVILDDNTTLSDITTTLPSGWTGTSSATGTSSGGVFTPALSFCISNVPAQVTVVAVSGTVFNDNGSGGGTANNCTKDGSEAAAGIPSGLFAKLIKAGAVVKVVPVDANGGFTMTAVSVGTGYTMIIDNNNSFTDAISNVPANWTVGQWAGDVTATTPFTAPALKFCMYYSLPTYTVTVPSNTVFNDGGAGGGAAGNCIMDGTEDATGLPSPLYAKLIQSGAVVQSSAVTSGGFSFASIPDGSYTIILDDNNTNTDATSNLPTGWIGTASWTGTITGGVLSPSLKFCINNPPAGPCAGSTSTVGASFLATYINTGGESTTLSSVDFATPASGILGTDRAGTAGIGAFSFAGAAMPLNVSNTNFVDGYVRKYGGANFTFPIGDNGVYRPAIVNWTDACPSVMEASYYGVDPNVGVTSKPNGGNFPTAPTGGPFPTNQRVSNLFSVSNKEYWDINGASQAEVTLTWNANSDITGLSTANLNNLSIAGWNPVTSKWERIASTITVGSTLTSGSIKTDATLVPNTYNVYTFAGTTISNIATIKTAPATISQFVPFDYTFTIKNNGTVPTTGNTIVRDTLKNGLKYISYSGAWTCAFAGTTAAGDDVVECTVTSTLTAGSSAVAMLRVNPTLGGPIANTSYTRGGGMTGGPYKSSTTEASAGTPQNPNAGSPTTSNVTPIPNLITTKVAPSTAVEQGVKFDYTLTVNNTGSVATSGTITVRDTLKNGLKYISYAGTNWTCSKTGIDVNGNDVVVCTSTAIILPNTGTSGIVLTVLPTQATNISNMTWTNGGGMPGGPYRSGPTTGTAGSVQNPTDGTPTGSGSTPGVLPVTPKPILVTTKVGPGTAITQYQDFDYIFTVTNYGAAPSTGAIHIIDTLRNGLIYQSTGGSGWTCSVTGSDANGNQILDCTTNNVVTANGDNDIVNVTVKATKATAISNIAWVSGGGIPGGPYPTSPVSTTAGNPLNPTPNAPVPTPNTSSPIASIATVKSASVSTIEQFMPFDYKFDLENKGSAATSGTLIVRDTLRNGLKYVSMVVGSPDWTCSLVGQDLSGNDVVQCQTSTPIAAYNAATLTGGTSTYTIKVKPTLAGNITNLAWVNGGGMPNGPYKTGATPGTAGSPINPGAGSPTAPTSVTPVPILKTAKIAPSVAAQQFVPFTYNFDVMNDGGAATTGTITIKDTLKNGLVYVSGGNASWTCAVTGTDASGNQIVECTSSAAIATATISSFPLSVKSTTGGAASNVAFVNGGGMPGGPYKTAPTTTNSGNPTNPTGGTPTTNNVTPVANLTTTKVAPTTTITQFVPFDYTMTVTNTGGANSGGTITVRDTLKTGLKYNGFAGTGWTCAKTGVDLYGNDVVVCTYSNPIAVNASASFTLNVNPTLATNVTNMTWTNGGGMPGGPYRSGATPATAGNINNPTGGSPTGTSPTTPVAPVPDLKTAKIIGSGPFNQNQPFTYNFQITNSGGISTSGLVTIVDTLKNGLKFVSGGNTDWTCVKTGVDANGNDIVRCTSFQSITTGNTTSFPLQVNPTQATTTSNLAWTSGGGMPGGPYKSGTTAATAGGPSNPTGGTPTAPTPIGPGLPDVILLIAQPSPTLTEGLQSVVQFTVTNQGNGTATGPINVNITLPTELSAPASFTSGNWSCTTAGVSISCSSQNTAGIPINTSVQFDVPVVAAIGSVGKTLSINGSIPPATNESITNNNSAVMTANNPVQTGTRPDLHTVIGTIPTLTEGLVSLIPVSVTNIGNGTATGGLTFSTNLPNGLSAPSTFTQNGWTCNTSGQSVNCTNPNTAGLAATAVTAFDIPVTPAIGSAGTTPTVSGLVNQVLNEIVTNNNTGTSTASQPVQPANRPDIQTIIGQPATPLVEGSPSNIPVILNNIGTAPATGQLTFSTNLPNGLSAPLTFADGAWTCNTSGQTVSCSNPNTAGLPATTGTTTFNIPLTPSVGTAGQTPTVTGNTSPVTNETATTNNTTSMTPTAAIASMPRPDLTTTIGQPAPELKEGVTSNIPVTLANIGNAPATGQLSFSTSLPNGLSAPPTFIENGWTCNTSGQNVSCTNPNAAGLPATTGTTTFNIPVTPANGSAGTTPTLTGSSAPAPNETSVGNNSGSMTPTTPIAAAARPDVVTTIGQPAPGFTEGSASNVPVTLTNIGNAPATGQLTFSMSLPNGLTAPATFSQNGWTCNTSGQNVSCTNPNTAGLPITTGTTTFNIPVTPVVGTAGQTPVVSGTASPVINETANTNNTGTMTPTNPIAAITRPDLATTIGQPAPGFTEGVLSNVPVTIANIGNAPATGTLTFSTTLPNGLSTPATFTNNNWTCSTTGQTVNCSTPNTAGLPATTGTTTFNLPITPVTGSAGQTPTLMGQTPAAINETTTANNTGSMTPTNPIIAAARPDLTTTVGTPSPVLTEGVTSDIPVTIANIGNAPATGPLTFTSMLPNGVSAPTTFTNNGWTCNTSGQTVTCTNPNTAGLPATTGSTTFNLKVTPQPGSAGTTPTISGTSTPVPNETTTGNNGGSLTLPAIVAAVKPDLAISYGTPSPALAETVISSIPVTIANIGTAAATGQVVVTINIPNNTTSLPSYTTNGWTCNASGTILTCATPNFAGIAAAASSTFDIKLTPNAGTAGQYIILNGSVSTAPDETSLANNSKVTIVPTPIAAPPSFALNLKVMLQGALLGTTDGLMRDNLRSQNLIPLTSPYDATLAARFTRVAETSVAQTTSAVLAANAGTPNAIVDWVFIEIRDGASASTVVKTISALVQRDGDIVSPNGTPLSVVIPAGNYFVSVKHRNHLGAMISNTVTFNGLGATVDFTNLTNAQLYNNAGYDGAEMATVGNVKALWLGNCNGDNKTKYDGAATDRTKIASDVLGSSANTSASYVFNNAFGYFFGDVNMDGKAKYDGIGNDRLIIQQTIQTYPLNTTLSNNYNNMLEQLP
jgi:Domain of unknown function DUF11